MQQVKKIPLKNENIQVFRYLFAVEENRENKN
jgi:hypothetical protein